MCEGNIPCLACPRCHAGETHLCANYDAVGFTRGGGFGELVVVPARVVHRLSAHVSFDAAVLVEPGSVVLKALERLRIRPAETVGVVGVGALGAIALTLARLHAPARLVAYGVREEELELARSSGPTTSSTSGRRTPKQRRRVCSATASTSSWRRLAPSTRSSSPRGSHGRAGGSRRSESPGRDAS